METAQQGKTIVHNAAGEAGERRLAIFQRLIRDGLAGGDIAVTKSIVRPEMVDHQEYGPGFLPGRDGVLGLEAALKIAIPDMQSEVEEIVFVDDQSWARVRTWGTFTGPYLGIPPTGRKIDIYVVESVRWAEDDSITEHWGVADRFGLMVDMGLIPEQAIPVFTPELVKDYVSPTSGERFIPAGSTNGS